LTEFHRLEAKKALTNLAATGGTMALPAPRSVSTRLGTP
jgi:hypothetical protein